MENPEILVIDDEKEMLVSYQKILSRAGYSVTTAETGDQGLSILNERQQVSLVLCDLKMPGMDGMEFLSILKQNYPHLPFIMVTGFGTLEIGIEAVKNGAYDFIEKPFARQKLLSTIESALKNILFPQENDKSVQGFDSIVGKSPAMRKIFDMIRKVSYGNANILITGESGVGKELIARSIHKHSLRRNHPIIPINCGALPEQLFESELFGYEKGAFTGAFQSKPGLVELANGGTLFLDEVCEMPQNMQVKLLRMLEERKIRRIGGQKEIPVNIRVLSATNRNLEDALKQEWLREDFFYRINTIQIHIPPLRERSNDIPLLVNHLLKGLEQKYNRNIQKIEQRALDVLCSYPWPGNVRELQNIIERTYYLASPPQIDLSDLPSDLQQQDVEEVYSQWENLPYKKAKERMLERFEKEYLLYHLNHYDWNISRTAEACGIDRRTIHRLINKYKLKK
ncbi:MAG: sigma-54-dependent Fis family transcriptional regulator [Calditrichaeota bacterium]|nr:sigma-54-dependent Fis family transcriptional regulator [Calditrichota bacterium]RQV93040.1 MAG: sigma-54-dependent Fis family transcriptional regulator [bacterium]RQW03931.1 MAG: sigma-54-dependent Fis family transcriptional regulator [Calditrichota bacterium]